MVDKNRKDGIQNKVSCNKKNKFSTYIKKKQMLD